MELMQDASTMPGLVGDAGDRKVIMNMNLKPVLFVYNIAATLQRIVQLSGSRKASLLFWLGLT